MKNSALAFWICIVLCFAFRGPVSYAQDQACPGTLISQLVPGQQGQVTPGNANNVRDQPARSGTLLFRIEAGTIFAVVAGPTCADGYAWWQITWNGQTGWTVEADDTAYFLVPFSPGATPQPSATAAQNECSMEPRLVIGQVGRLTSTTPSRLRDQASPSGKQIGQIEPLDTFSILDGPVCAAGINWWQVAVGAANGWTAEGVDGEYFLELAPLVPTATPPFVPLPTAYHLDWSSDGSIIAVSTTEGIFVYQVDDPDQPPMQLLAGHRVGSLAFDPIHPTQLAISTHLDENLVVQIIDITNGEVLRPIEDMRFGWLLNLTFSADGQRLALNRSGTLSVVDPATGEQTYSVYPMDYTDGSIQFSGFATTAFSPDGQWVSGTYPGGRSSIAFIGSYGATAAELVGIESVPIPDGITAIAFGPENDRVVMGDDRGNLRMWQLADFAYLSFIRGDRSTTSNYINALAFSPSDSVIATAESDPLAVVRIFDATKLTQTSAHILQNTPSSAVDLAYNPDGTRLAVLVEGTVFILETETYSTIAQLVLHRN